MTHRRPVVGLTAIALAATLGLSACGTGSMTANTVTRTTPAPTTPAATTPAVGDAAGVIREWADTLRRGDTDGASRYFAVPSTVANGTGPIRLATRAAVRFFNETLPCGAVLVSTKPGPRGLVIATFRLTERPGPGVCGNGTGHTARTAFRIRDGQIVAWLRVNDPPEARGTPV